MKKFFVVILAIIMLIGYGATAVARQQDMADDENLPPVTKVVPPPHKEAITANKQKMTEAEAEAKREDFMRRQSKMTVLGKQYFMKCIIAEYPDPDHTLIEDIGPKCFNETEHFQETMKAIDECYNCN